MDEKYFQVFHRKTLKVSEGASQINKYIKSISTINENGQFDYTYKQCNGIFICVAQQLKGKENASKWCCFFGRTKKTAQTHRDILDLVPEKYKI